MPLSVGMDAAVVVGPTSWLINSTQTQPCQIIEWMPLSVGMDAALVMGPVSLLHQLHRNPTLSIPLQPCSITDRMLLSVGMDAALGFGPTNFSINSTPTQPC